MSDCCDACKDVRMIPVRCAHCHANIGEAPRDTASCDWNPLRLEAMRDKHAEACAPYAAVRALLLAK